MTGLSLNGKVALVTGASSGLGAHFAEVLAKAGAHVAVAARRADRLRALEKQLLDRGPRALAVEMDVTDRESVAVALDAVEKDLGSPNVLINNAGVATNAPALQVTDEDWRKVLATNLDGAWIVAQEAARRMQKTGGGSIVNTASILGVRVTGGVAPYAISKAGLVQMTKVLALELARYGIRVNAIAPGYVSTELNADFLESEPGQAVLKRVPMRRFGTLNDLDGPLLLLASDASAYMTGTILPVDGGHLVSGL